MTFIICSFAMPWDQLCIYLHNLSHHAMPVRADGFCFLHAVDMVLYCDHDVVVTFDSMESIIMGHLAASIKYYKQFHIGDVLKDAERYFKFRMYCYSVLDVITVVTARALKLNLTIYQKGLKGNLHIFKHSTNVRGKEVHLKFTWDPCNVANNYYEAILLLHKPTERHREDEVTIESPYPSTL